MKKIKELQISIFEGINNQDSLKRHTSGMLAKYRTTESGTKLVRLEYGFRDTTLRIMSYGVPKSFYPYWKKEIGILKTIVDDEEKYNKKFKLNNSPCFDFVMGVWTSSKYEDQLGKKYISISPSDVDTFNFRDDIAIKEFEKLDMSVDFDYGDNRVIFFYDEIGEYEITRSIDIYQQLIIHSTNISLTKEKAMQKYIDKKTPLISLRSKLWEN